MTGMLSSGTSALLAFQRALGTVSHNVANATTPGYSRQRVTLHAVPGTYTPDGVPRPGMGVQVVSVDRVRPQPQDHPSHATSNQEEAQEGRPPGSLHPDDVHPGAQLARRQSIRGQRHHADPVAGLDQRRGLLLYPRVVGERIEQEHHHVG